jgi:hypothetical protein
MESVGFSVSHGSRVPRGAPTRRLRAPWRRGVWSSAEVASALHAQRAELLTAIGNRSDARALAPDVLEEVVNDATCVVVMMRKPIRSEEHLLGAFWIAARMLLRQHREGRHTLRVGSRLRVGLEDVAAHMVTKDPGPDDLVALKDRVARAADFAAQLTELEREVVAVMALRGVGVKRTAHLLGAPVKAVKAAQRSAQGKLDRVAAIAAAGRMCGYRREAIAAYASGAADADDERAARAHLATCAPCRRSYAQLMREMRGRAFQRDTAAAFLPAPLLAVGYHFGLLGRVAIWGAERPVRVSGERAAELLGGAGVVKVAAAGGALVAATATIAGGMHTSQHRHHHRHHSATATTRHLLGRQASTNTLTGASTSPSSRVDVSSTAGALTPRERAEREFALPRSTARAEFHDKRATTASLRTSSAAEVSESEPAPPPLDSSDPATHAEASQAAREFGQP